MLELALFRTFRPRGTWPPACRRLAELGLFGTIPLGHRVEPGQIGFVSPRSPAGQIRHNSFPTLYLSFTSLLRELGLFRTIGPPNWLCFAQSPRAGSRRQAAGQASGRGAVSNPQSTNWLCFAQSTWNWNGGMMEYWNIGAPDGRHGRHRLGAPLRAIGFVSHHRPAGARGGRFVPNPQSDNSAEGGRRLPGAVPEIRNPQFTWPSSSCLFLLLSSHKS
jgi:hypothetical protein